MVLIRKQIFQVITDSFCLDEKTEKLYQITFWGQLSLSTLATEYIKFHDFVSAARIFECKKVFHNTQLQFDRVCVDFKFKTITILLLIRIRNQMHLQNKWKCHTETMGPNLSGPLCASCQLCCSIMFS